MDCPKCGTARKKYHPCPQCGWLPASMGQMDQDYILTFKCGAVRRIPGVRYRNGKETRVKTPPHIGGFSHCEVHRGPEQLAEVELVPAEQG